MPGVGECYRALCGAYLGLSKLTNFFAPVLASLFITVVPPDSRYVFNDIEFQLLTDTEPRWMYWCGLPFPQILCHQPDRGFLSGSTCYDLPQTYHFRPNHQMASLPSRTDALILEFFLCHRALSDFLSMTLLATNYPLGGESYIRGLLSSPKLLFRHTCVGPICALERVRGVGPPSAAWKAAIIAVIRHPHIITLRSVNRASILTSTFAL